MESSSPSFNILKLSDVQRRANEKATAEASILKHGNASSNSLISLQGSVSDDFDPLEFLQAPKGDFEMYRERIQKGNRNKLSGDSTSSPLAF